MRYKLIDCCPAPLRLYPFLVLVKRRSGCTFQSIYRGTDARKLLAKCGKHDQAYLYEHQGEPGIGPANPPGRSTHELRSDGVAYPGPVGRKLEWWQCGLDVDDAHVDDAEAAVRHFGWQALLHRPYSAGSEYHHLNFTRKPTVRGAAAHRIKHHLKKLRRGNRR